MPGALGWQDFRAHGRTVSTDAFRERAANVRETDAAFILYTSGSLAEPKGVLLNHGGVIGNAHGMGERRAIVSEDRIWLGSPLFYGLGATNALPIALTRGAALVLQGSFEAGAAITAINSSQATVWYGTGNMARAILDHPDYSQKKIGSLKKGNAGTMAEYKRRQDHPLGGASATVGNHDDPLEAKLHTAGTPLPGFELRIVDPTTFAPVTPGQVGLVLLRGYTTPGYFANPEETMRALRPDGFFDTGDLGHLDSDGRFVFHSRLKEVIKSGGINVSPIEVEQLLVQHPHVRDAHVVGVADSVRGELIVAFVDATHPTSEIDLRNFVKERAASFKVPHHVFFRNEHQLPRLASGKVAKFRLAEEAKHELGL